MKNNSAFKPFASPKRERRLRSTAEAVSALFEHMGGKEQARLTALWKNWNKVMDASVTSLGCPLGHNDAILLIGADDNMAMQELSLLSAEILERANSFMQSDFFSQVKVVLMQGRPDLSNFRSKPQDPLPARTEEQRFPRLGRLLNTLNPDSPVTQCYQAIVALSQKK